MPAKKLQVVEVAAAAAAAAVASTVAPKLWFVLSSASRMCE